MTEVRDRQRARVYAWEERFVAPRDPSSVAFVQAQGARGLVAVAHDTLANQQKHLEQTQGFVEVGTQAPIALSWSPKW